MKELDTIHRLNLREHSGLLETLLALLPIFKEMGLTRHDILLLELKDMFNRHGYKIYSESCYNIKENSDRPIIITKLPLSELNEITRKFEV